MFICSFAICISSLVKLSVQTISSWNNYLYSLEASPLSDLWFEKLFSQSVACLSIFLTVSFEGQALINFDEVQFNNFFGVWFVLVVSYLRNLCLFQSHSHKVSPVFYSRSFIGLHFSIWFISNCFIYNIRKGWDYCFPYPLSSTIFWKRLLNYLTTLVNQFTRGTSSMTSWRAQQTHSSAKLLKMAKNSHLISMEIVLWINSKWRNIYSRTFLFW